MTELTHVLHLSARGGSPIDLLVLLFGVSLIPLLAVSATSFTRIVVVLGLLRAALGTQSLPPNAVLIALAILLSGIVMTPTLARVRTTAVAPYLEHRISEGQALDRGADVLKRFMLRQTRASDLAAFSRLSRSSGTGDPPLSVVAPAFMVGELRAAFAMGFALVLPFAVIDIVVAAVMMSLGMFMVSPASISLPCKLLVFVAADGWTTVCQALVSSFR